MMFACCMVNSIQAQVKKTTNPALDSLKQGVRNIGQLFKKASLIQVEIADVKGTDPRLASFIKSVRQVPGITRLRQEEKSPDVMLELGYKGNHATFWSQVPAQAKKNFASIQVTDSVIRLAYVPQSKNDPASAVSAGGSSSAYPQHGEAKVNEKMAVNNVAHADTEVLTKGAALLFANIKSTLNNGSKNMIFKMFDMRIAKNGKQFTQEGGEDYPFNALVYPVDLNADGKEEIFILFGNSFTSGMTGSSIVAFFPVKAGFQVQLGFSGTLPEVLATGNQGFPDLLIGGPGFEFPVQRWNGRNYDFYRKISDKDMAKLKMTSLEDISIAYTSKLK